MKYFVGKQKNARIDMHKCFDFPKSSLSNEIFDRKKNVRKSSKMHINPTFDDS